MAIIKRIVIVSLVAVLALGDSMSILAQNRPRTRTNPTRAIVIVVGGVGGWDPLPACSQIAFRRAGLEHEVREFVWTHGFGQWLKDLQDIRYLVCKADELAQEIRRLYDEDPDRPIYLVAKSGCTGLALMAAERLPARTIRRIVLLSAAVSADYDLRSALRATQHEIVSFYSPHDSLVLDWGTRQFGTIDRVYTSSAGLRGFQIPSDFNEGDRELYNRLVQVRWSPRMIREGYMGGHAATSFPTFLRIEVVPWLD